MASNKVLVPLAGGFEEIEAVTIIDVLRRAEVDVVVAGLRPGAVRGAHGITVETDATLSGLSSDDFRMIVLPGGMPGSQHLKDDADVQRMLRELGERGAYTAAICAAPMALAPSGVTAERTVTSYPGFDEHVVAAHYVENRVVVDGPVITSRGPGTALEFALTLVAKLEGADRAAALEAGMLVARSEPAREVTR